jgi:hypothetical protein
MTQTKKDLIDLELEALLREEQEAMVSRCTTNLIVGIVCVMFLTSFLRST